MRGRIPSSVIAGVAAALMLCMAAALGVAPLNAYDDAETPLHRESLRMPDMRGQLEKLADAGATYVHEASIQRSDTIATLFVRLGVDDPDAQEFIRKSATARPFFDLEPGQIVLAEVDQDNLLVSLRATLGGDVSVAHEMVVERTGGPNRPDFTTNLHAVKNELRYEMRSGLVAADGFFKAMDAADVPDDIVRQMISIFSGVVDFHSGIVPGDRFRIVYETGFRNGTPVRNGRIVAVELVNRTEPHQAVWYPADGSNDGAYYTFDGRRMTRTFLRSPVEFTRVSSGFGWRDHPLHHQWVKHNGIDFAAPTGTRVFATADGAVEFAGQQTGYGNVVVLKHRDGYSTYYAHLSRFAGIRPGVRVTQGQLIAYVGETGWATGPHLHYELRFHDAPQNPLSVVLMEPATLTGLARQRFLTYKSALLGRLDALRTIDVASSRN
ncbi:peptidoglycan DD-metalloendopeptidase family protein [Cupriavidus sp. PET2-C1]